MKSTKNPAYSHPDLLTLNFPPEQRRYCTWKDQAKRRQAQRAPDEAQRAQQAQRAPRIRVMREPGPFNHRPSPTEEVSAVELHREAARRRDM